MENDERKLKALSILKKIQIVDPIYLGQGFEGVVFHNNEYVYKVLLPFLKAKDKWKTYRHLTFFIDTNNENNYESFYSLNEIIEYEGVFIEKYPYEISEPVICFSEEDVIQFLTESWQKKVLIQDCKKENFIRVNGKIKLIDLDGSTYYSDNLFLNICIRMFLYVHEDASLNLKKIQRSAINNFDLTELVQARVFLNKVFLNIIYSESYEFLDQFKILKFKDIVYEEYYLQEMPNIEMLFFSKIKENLYISDFQISDILLNKSDAFEPKNILIGYKEIISINETVSLLIKTCAQDCETIEANIKHIVKQLLFPNTFNEIIVSIDCKKENFVRQYNENSNIEELLKIIDRLKKEKVIDRYFIFEPLEAARINKDWFNLSTNETHSSLNVPISSQLFAFEQCKSTYIFQMDSDVMIGRTDFSHSYIHDMISEIEKNDTVISVGFNIFNSESKPYFGFENGGFVPEVRMGLFHKERLFNMRPLPNSLDCNNKLMLTWYRSLEKKQKETGFSSIRGGDKRSFFVHPQNYRKTSPYSWLNIIDRIEQNFLPEFQLSHFDCEGSFYDWCNPKRNEKMVILSCFRDISIDRFIRMWSSLMNQTFQDFGIIFYDDCSNNGISLLIEFIIKPFKDRITFIKGRTYVPKIQCEYIALHNYCDNPESIIVCIDTDDALIGKEVLFDIYTKYTMWNVDLTCGRVHQTYRLQPYYRYPVNFIEPRKTGGNVWQHLKTFKKYLFDSIPIDYFKYQDNGLKLTDKKWFEKCDDFAIMIPMVEMSTSPYQMDFINYFYERDYENKDLGRELKDKCITEIIEKKSLSPEFVIKGRKCFPANFNQIEIDITFECNLNCKGCNRSCAYAPSKECMTLDQIRSFISESKELGKKWGLINILGGEPTLHKKFLEILEILQVDYADSFNKSVIIQVVSNGFTEESRMLCMETKKYKNVRIDFASFKSKNKIEYFTPFNDAPIDDEKFKDANYSAACWVASYCGVALNRNGYYGCSVCGGIDRVLKGKEGVSMLKDFNEEKAIMHYKKFCKYCGNFKEYHYNKGEFVPRNEKRPFSEIISSTWRELYAKY